MACAPRGERGGSVVECQTPEREVRGSKPTAAVLCPWARHFTPWKYWLLTQEAMAPSRYDWKIVDWDVKPQHNQMCAQRRLRSAWASTQSDQSPAKTLISLGIRPVCSESSLCAQWVAKDPRFLHADSEVSDQTGCMPRLIWVFAGRTGHFVGYVMRRLKYLACLYFLIASVVCFFKVKIRKFSVKLVRQKIKITALQSIEMQNIGMGDALSCMLVESYYASFTTC